MVYDIGYTRQVAIKSRVLINNNSEKKTERETS